MIIVTGGAGFIGSRIIKELNRLKFFNILLVDDLTDATKIANIKDLNVRDYIDKDKFIETFIQIASTNTILAVYHMGAESSTTCSDGKYLMENNYQYTCNIADICASNNIPLLYASSASVYGDSDVFDSDYDNYQPNNMYGFSKLQTDRYIRPMIEKGHKIVGCRFFNVYSDGEFETHKEGMKSPTAWMNDQYNKYGRIELFEGSDNFKRDFIHVNTVILKIIKWMAATEVSGIFNVGTGTPRSFKELALDITDEEYIDYIPMPEHIKSGYQAYTCADISNNPP